MEQVLVGKEKKDRIMSKEERRIVSYHETGHALASFEIRLIHNDPPVETSRAKQRLIQDLRQGTHWYRRFRKIPSRYRRSQLYHGPWVLCAT